MAGTVTPPRASGDGPDRPAPGDGGGPGRRWPVRPDASMTLLREVMERPLDPGYADAAARPRRRSRQRTVVTLVLATLAGFLTAVSVAEIGGPQPEAKQASERLRAEIQRGAADARRLEAENAALRSDIASVQEEALRGGSGAALVAEAGRLGGVTGELPVAGPGLEFTVDDAAGSRDDAVGSDPRNQQELDLGIVLDRDLQVIVNGLWEAGAEAIAINGQRLTSLSAIRSAGEAILVDFRPLVPPYVIDVVGDPSGLQAAFAAGTAGPYVQSMRDNSGITVNITAKDSVRLPGAGELVLRSARPPATATTPGSAATRSSTRSSESRSAGPSRPAGTPSGKVP